ncbi:PAS domain S-box protein [Fulvimarina endophytica]|uniref:Blue-light-activated histidine kinase n=1 Tax=Fulvimarina endophytica TaxID=2293836 RepID=A0A371X7J3_9HYPH|nr:PAS domain-containing protein [Fulvimarina endophytica]RFC65209.1 PAS domain S-box protein [Fulvimarina endophytica]
MTSFDFARQFEILPQPHAIFCRDLRFVAVNKAFEASAGMTAAALIGRKLFDMFPGEGMSRERLRASLDRVIETGERSSIAFLRYDIPDPNGVPGTFVTRFWSLTYSPMLDEAGNTEFIVATIVDVTQIAEDNARSAEEGLEPQEIEAIEARREQPAPLGIAASSEVRTFRRLFREAPGLFAVLEGADLRFSFVNEALSEFASDRFLFGRAFFDALPELKEQGVAELASQALAGRYAVIGETVRIQSERSAEGEPVADRFFDFTFSPLTDNEGKVVGLFFQGVDRTQSMRATTRHRILVDELNHRVKNTLSTVQAMARQSFRSAGDPEDARDAFEARIMALSQTHNILSASRWESASLATLIHQRLAGLPRARLSVRGPLVLLSPKPAIALALALHELASNASRHGAFAQAGGTLAVSWTCRACAGGQMLSLEWTETAPVPIEESLRPGYGIRIVRRIVEGELDGDLVMDLGTEGFSCRLDVLLSEVGYVETSVA